AKIFYVISLLIPIFFFVLLEGGLRIFNYGYDYTQWVNPIKGKYVLNPGVAHKYFHDIQGVPYSNGDIFDEVKKPEAFRVFVLGESSGAGYPFSPIGSFSRYLQQRLRLVYPESKIEVINCSLTAVNSYTMRDLLPGILREQPDLILIYAGHNEYYGALGVGSLESFGTSRRLINLVIYLEQFKTFQLLRNLIDGAVRLFGGNGQAPSGTLMARMAQNQYIGLHSDVYKNGIDQFEGNMHDMLESARDNNVPVILGTLACNLKDQPPFVSIDDGGLPPAQKIYEQAKESFAKNEWHTADSLFRYAKDLDALRFRAPTKINTIIENLGKEFHYPIVDIDSAFDAESPGYVVGDNLMTDHLHPTLHGYQLMGNLFYDEMEKTGLLPKSTPRNISNHQQDSITIATFPFTRIDSVIGDYRIKLLKNDWPYINRKNIIPAALLLQPHDYIDSIALKLVEDKTTWDIAHTRVAQWYASKNDIASFLREMDVLISQYPIVVEYYDNAANMLLEAKNYDKAYSYLAARNEIEPSAFSTKWMGIISLSKHQTATAEKFLNQSITFDRKDPQVWYNLAGVYIAEKDYQKALQVTEKALALNPHYADALALHAMLRTAVK
ncbi:MAG: tetratricopeptide repeat protein, partial [Bacteroidota bacterium]